MPHHYQTSSGKKVFLYKASGQPTSPQSILSFGFHTPANHKVSPPICGIRNTSATLPSWFQIYMLSYVLFSETNEW